MVSRSTYDAYLFYLVKRDAGKQIDWEDPALQTYADENNSKEGESLDWKVESHRKNFIRKAARYEVLEVNGKKLLAKLEKGDETSSDGTPVFVKRRVICDDEYEKLLDDFHDKKGHPGFIKCYYEVGILIFFHPC